MSTEEAKPDNAAEKSRNAEREKRAATPKKSKTPPPPLAVAAAHTDKRPPDFRNK